MRWRRAALAALLALAGCGGPRVAAHPAMWRVSDGDTTIWLLGSIHVLPPNVDWRTPLIDRAIAEADTLVLESSPDEQVDFRAMAEGVGLKPLAERVSPGKLPMLKAMIERSGTDRAILDGYEDWAAAVVLDNGDAKAENASRDDGVERKLWDAFDQSGKTRTTFYRAKEQLSQLNDLPAALQREMLENTLAPKLSFGETLKAWESGDLVSLEKHATCTPLDGRLVGQPNDRWSKWIAWRMRKPGNVLIAVGLGHMVGPYALPKLLATRGLKVERVQ